MAPDADDMTVVVVTLRAARPDDASDIAAVWQAAWHDGHRGRVPEALIQARDTAYFAERTRDLLDRVTVAIDGDQLLGVLIVKGDELQQLMVSAAARGRGVGALLLTEAERQVAGAGHDEIWLAVVPGNATARRFYEAHGWVDHGEETYDAVTLSGGTVGFPSAGTSRA
jgi:ribosomal protein S18 acetylase RimI-like enzyme